MPPIEIKQVDDPRPDATLELQLRVLNLETVCALIDWDGRNVHEYMQVLDAEKRTRKQTVRWVLERADGKLLPQVGAVPLLRHVWYKVCQTQQVFPNFSSHRILFFVLGASFPRPQ